MCFWRLAARVKLCYQNKNFKNKSRYIELKNEESKMLLSKTWYGPSSLLSIIQGVMTLVMMSIQLKEMFGGWCKQFLNWKQKFKLIPCNHRVSLRWCGLESLLLTYVHPFHHRILYPGESQSRYRNSGKLKADVWFAFEFLRSTLWLNLIHFHSSMTSVLRSLLFHVDLWC